MLSRRMTWAQLYMQHKQLVITLLDSIKCTNSPKQTMHVADEKGVCTISSVLLVITKQVFIIRELAAVCGFMA